MLRSLSFVQDLCEPHEMSGSPPEKQDSRKVKDRSEKQ